MLQTRPTPQAASVAQPSIAQPLRHVHPSGFVWVFGPGHAHVLLKPGSFGLTGFMWKRQSSATSVPVGALGQKIEVFTKPAGHCGAQIEPSGIRPPRPECAATQTLSSEAAQPLGRAWDTAGTPLAPAPSASVAVALLLRPVRLPAALPCVAGGAVATA